MMVSNRPGCRSFTSALCSTTMSVRTESSSSSRTTDLIILWRCKFRWQRLNRAEYTRTPLRRGEKRVFVGGVGVVLIRDRGRHVLLLCVACPAYIQIAPHSLYAKVYINLQETRSQTGARGVEGCSHLYAFYLLFGPAFFSSARTAEVCSR